MSAESSQPENLAQTDLKRGKKAFEAGQYRSATRCFEQALGAADPGTAIHGEIMIWLVTAYEAIGDRETARDLCKVAAKHPHWHTRKEGKRLLYILEAPVLRRRAEWQTQIPDLEDLDEQDGKKWGSTNYKPSPPRKLTREDTGYKIAEPTDPTQVETEDRAFIWVALAAISLILLGLTWFGLQG